MSEQPDNPGRFTLPPRVRKDERDYINRRREAVGLDSVADATVADATVADATVADATVANATVADATVEGDRSGVGVDVDKNSSDASPLVGLAISGGGIRSATFSLGILQMLARRKVLPAVDYLCTVSGGGYLGSCLSSLMTIPKSQGDRDENPPVELDSADQSGAEVFWQKSNFNMGDNMPLGDPQQIHHLRRHGDFLITRQGVFLREVIRAIGTYVAGLISTMGLFLAALMMLLGTLFWFGWADSGEHLWKTIHDGNEWIGWTAAINSTSLTWRSFFEMAIAGAFAAVAARLTAFGWAKQLKNRIERVESDSPSQSVKACWQFLFLVSVAVVIVSAVSLGYFDLTCLKAWLSLSAGLLVGFLSLFRRNSRVANSRGERTDEELERKELWCFVTSLILYSGLFSALITWESRCPTLLGPFDNTDGLIWNFKDAVPDWQPAGEQSLLNANNGKLEVELNSADGTRRLQAVVPAVVSESATAIPSVPFFSDLLRPAAVFLGALVATWVLYVALAWTHHPLASIFLSGAVWDRRNRSVFGAMIGICLYGLVASLSATALILFIWWVKDETGIAQTVAAVSLVVARICTANRAKPSADKTLLQKVKTEAPKWLLKLAVPLLILAAIVIGAQLALSSSIETFRWLPIGLFAIGLLSLVFLGSAIEFNCISLHYFYRDRLDETYLQTEAHLKSKSGSSSRLGLIRDDADLLLKDLHDRHIGEHDEPNPAPYHLILTALNLPGSRDLARKDRKSDHFVFSKKYCGSTTTGYLRTAEYWGGATKLSIAMTISGAAASSSMGFQTSFTQAFAMTLFNIRLGSWMANPSFYPNVIPPSAYAWRESSQSNNAADKSSADKNRENEIGATVNSVPAPDRVRKFFTFWPTYLFHELTAWTNARRRLINLSDGGHTGDNIGLYPLLQRRCRLIIACDGECDPKYEFGSLCAAMRQIYTDENIGTDFDIKQMQPVKKDGLPQRHYLIGRITYPVKDDTGQAMQQFDDDPRVQSAIGYIIYLKATYTNNDEAATVKSYAARNPDFPHQTTADQFFDDDQFESYRALGAVVAKSALEDALAKPKSKSKSEGPALREIVDTLINWCASHFEDGFYHVKGKKKYHTATCRFWKPSMEAVKPDAARGPEWIACKTCCPKP